jgi:hypothetical protein
MIHEACIKVGIHNFELGLNQLIVKARDHPELAPDVELAKKQLENMKFFSSIRVELILDGSDQSFPAKEVLPHPRFRRI